MRRWTFGSLRTATSEGPSEVVKVGGSLLSLPGWPDLVAGLVHGRSSRRRVLIVMGGGAIVDGLRAIDGLAPQPAETMHFLAIDLLGTTARLVARSLALPLVGEPGAAPVAVLDVPQWLGAAGRHARLPVGWHVTSDSIAALVAAEAGADLLLAKRVPPPPTDASPLAALARGGWVDGHFPTAAAQVARITWAAPESVPIPGVGRTLGEGGDAGGG
ncbi:MAG: hypothetical protein ACKOB1_03295 [Planctomycetia bacterium]